jgi:hypothetical protein
MMRMMRHRLIGLAIAFAAVALSPLIALGQDQPKIAPYDGRIEGYGKQLTLDAGTSALTWLLLIFLGVVCLGVLFKHARRTHLD